MENIPISNMTILIPAYNEARTIRKIVQETLLYASQIIVVDDGSQDETAHQLKDLPITLIQNFTNEGKGFSLIKGFSEALKQPTKGVVTMDADGQHNPKDIVRFSKAVEQYPEHLIIGARLRNQAFSPRYRLTANKIADWFISLAAHAWMIDTQSGFRFYPMAFLRKLSLMSFTGERFEFESRILIEAAHLGFLFGMLPIDAYYPKEARNSHYRRVFDTLAIATMLFQQFFKRGVGIKRLYQMLRVEEKQPLLLLEE